MVIFLMSSCSAPPAHEDSMPAIKTPEGSLDTALAAQSATFAPISFPTQTPLPTLSPIQVAEIIRGLYTNNSDCQLPCLWGISPGETTIQDVYHRFSQIGSFRDITRPVDALPTIAFTTSPPRDLISVYDDDKWSILMRAENDVVIGFVAGVSLIKEFSAPSLATFLTYFGKPEEIRVRIIESMLIDENPDYEVALYYPTKGIFIRWRDESGFVVSQTEKNIMVMICPQYMPTEADTLKGSYPPFFYLFSPNENMPFNEIIETHLSEDPSGSYQPLEKTNIEEFYTMYLDSANENCFPFDYSFSP